MTEMIESNRKIKVFIDDEPEDPRDFDNLGIMLFGHKTYDLGDKNAPHELINESNSWGEVKDKLMRKFDIAVLLPVYMMDHTVLSIQTTPFGGDYGYFDSGQIGFVYTTKTKIRNWYNVKKVTKNIKNRAEKELLSEIDIYDSYLRDEVYGFQIYYESKCPCCGHVETIVEMKKTGFYGRIPPEEVPEEFREKIKNNDYDIEAL